MLRINWQAAFAALVSLSAAAAAEWQWSVDVPPPAERSFESPRAYLWIPPGCDRVRGVVFAQHNMEEIGVMEHPEFRETSAELGFAQVWVAPGMDLYFRFDQGAGAKFERMMADLADVSGYGELASAPLVVLGHSAAASLPWIMAAWKPERIVAGISISGQYPYVWDPKLQPHVLRSNVDSVPGLVTLGEYEWADERVGHGLKIRREHPGMPLSFLRCPADGHFLATGEKIRFLALYLKKAAEHRMPAEPGGALRPIDTAKSGWLAPPFRNGAKPGVSAGAYQGDPAGAFWWFDGELARAAALYQERRRGKAALLGFEQGGRVVEQANGSHQQVNLSFEPEDDGVTFKLRGTFLDKVPAGRPERWAGKKAGEAIEMPAEGPPIDIVRICGPVKRIDCETWRLEMDRACHLGDRRGNEAWLAAVWPGDARWKQAMQQARLGIPTELKEGAAQEISFALPESEPEGTMELPLRATSTSGMKVRFYVREGPAEAVGDTLVFKPIPPRARRPVKVTVVAWQFGRASEPKVRTAAPVEKVLWIGDRS